MAELGEHEIFTDKNGARRLRIKGRKGFPLTMLDGETPEQALERHERKKAENAARKAERPPAPEEPPAGNGWGQVPGDLADKLSKLPPPPEGGDPPPRREPKKPATTKKPSTAELAKVLEELLVLPAIPMGMPVFESGPQLMQDGQPTGYVLGADGKTPVPAVHPRCEYCRDHFIQAGPQAAQEIAKLSEQSEPLRRLLERLYSAWGMLTIGSVLSGYVLKPALHHLAPAPVREGLGPVVDPSMPAPFPKSPRHRHAKSAPGAQAASGQPGAEPAPAA